MSDNPVRDFKMRYERAVREVVGPKAGDALAKAREAGGSTRLPEPQHSQVLRRMVETQEEEDFQAAADALNTPE